MTRYFIYTTLGSVGNNLVKNGLNTNVHAITTEGNFPTLKEMMLNSQKENPEQSGIAFVCITELSKEDFETFTSDMP